MRFDEAREVGESFTRSLLARWRSDERNARFIGRFAVDGMIAKLRDRAKRATSLTDLSPSDNGKPDSDPVGGSSAKSSQAVSAPTFSILSASELVEYLAHCSSAEASAILEHEMRHLCRSQVIDAAKKKSS